MPRIPGKSRKIAWNLIGVPSNMIDSSKSKDKKIRQRLNYEETQRVK